MSTALEAVTGWTPADALALADEHGAVLLPACWSWPAPEPGMDLAAWQACRCAVCGRCAVCEAERARPVRLVVDHEHATGLVRGLLCRGCNAAEGLVRPGRPQWGLFELYRLAPPALLCGLVLDVRGRTRAWRELRSACVPGE